MAARVSPAEAAPAGRIRRGGRLPPCACSNPSTMPLHLVPQGMQSQVALVFFTSFLQQLSWRSRVNCKRDAPLTLCCEGLLAAGVPMTKHPRVAPAAALPRHRAPPAAHCSTAGDRHLQACRIPITHCSNPALDPRVRGFRRQTECRHAHSHVVTLKAENPPLAPPAASAAAPPAVLLAAAALATPHEAGAAPCAPPSCRSSAPAASSAAAARSAA